LSHIIKDNYDDSGATYSFETSTVKIVVGAGAVLLATN